MNERRLPLTGSRTPRGNLPQAHLPFVVVTRCHSAADLPRTLEFALSLACRSPLCFTRPTDCPGAGPCSGWFVFKGCPSAQKWQRADAKSKRVERGVRGGQKWIESKSERALEFA